MALPLPDLAGHARRLEHCDVFQQRNDADDDHDNLCDLLRAAVERHPSDEIKNQHDYQEGDQDADEN